VAFFLASPSTRRAAFIDRNSPFNGRQVNRDAPHGKLEFGVGERRPHTILENGGDGLISSPLLVRVGPTRYSIGMMWHGMSTLEPGKRDGRPCAFHVRITVENIIGSLAAGMSHQLAANLCKC
jgi:hypothetical protein